MKNLEKQLHRMHPQHEAFSDAVRLLATSLGLGDSQARIQRVHSVPDVSERIRFNLQCTLLSSRSCA